MNETKEYFEKAKTNLEKMKLEIPDTVQGFGVLFSKVMKDGAITALEKELIAVGIGVAVHCIPCIRSHVKKCLDAGATRQQILEAASVAVMMGGGPAYTHVPIVLEILEDLQGVTSDKS
jgi:AhpD family alkylhydroperoxidase